ncbi:mCG146449, partial [Mus musculus]
NSDYTFGSGTRLLVI